MAFIVGRLVSSVARRTALPRGAPVWMRNSSGSAGSPATGSQSGLTNFEKRILVWTKKYKTLADVPDTVSPTTMRTARDRFRWRMAVYGMILTVLGSLTFVIMGKREAARGESTMKKGLAWHEELRPGSTKN